MAVCLGSGVAVAFLRTPPPEISHEVPQKVRFQID